MAHTAARLNSEIILVGDSVALDISSLSPLPSYCRYRFGEPDVKLDKQQFILMRKSFWLVTVALDISSPSPLPSYCRYRFGEPYVKQD